MEEEGGKEGWREGHGEVCMIPPLTTRPENPGQLEHFFEKSRVVVRRFFSLLARNLARCDVSLAIDGSVQEKSCVGAS